MKHILKRSILLGAFATAPFAVIAGGVEIVTPNLIPTIDIPDLRAGWGGYVETTALRPFNNNLNYFLDQYELTGANGPFDLISTFNIFESVDPQYAFALRVGVDYTFNRSANVLRLDYEHYFDHKSIDEYQDVANAINVEGSVREKLDDISLLSEQHILIGPYWETTLLGGARFAHLRQELNARRVHVNFAAAIPPSFVLSTGSAGPAPSEVETTINSQIFNMQFNGVGPAAGLGTLFHFFENFSAGAEVQGALLIGRNKLVEQNNHESFNTHTGFITETNLTTDDENIFSIVPELQYKFFGNYFYQFNNGSELEVELGWRVTEYFNVRTFDQIPVTASTPYGTLVGGTPVGGNPTPGARTRSSSGADITSSDDIGFGGPYLQVHYKL